jgi:hypothetical protein
VVYQYSGDAMSKSTTYKGEDGTIKKSATVYAGDEGEEKAD